MEYPLIICNNCCTNDNEIPEALFIETFPIAFAEWKDRVEAATSIRVDLSNASYTVCKNTVSTQKKLGDDWVSVFDTYLEICFYASNMPMQTQTSLGIDPCVKTLISGTSGLFSSSEDGKTWFADYREFTPRLDFTFGVAETKQAVLPIYSILCDMSDFAYALSSTPAGFTINVFLDASKNIVIEAEYDGVGAIGTYSNEINMTACGEGETISPFTYVVA